MPHACPSLLPYVITILALSLPSPSCHSLPLRLSLVLLILSLTTYILTSTALPLASLNFSQGAALAAHLFATTDFLLLSDVHAELKRDGQTGAWATMGVCERVRWAASLVTSPRLIGWSSTSPPSRASTSPPSTSKPPSTPSFILHQSLHLLLELLTLLALLFLSPSLPHLSAPGPPLASAPWPTRALYTPLLGLAMYLSIDAPHRLYTLSLLCIANPIIRAYNAVSVRPLVLWMPADFRPLFGEWRDTYTLRRFWGRTWQQTHRRHPSISRTFHIYRIHRTAFLLLHSPVSPYPPYTDYPPPPPPLARIHPTPSPFQKFKSHSRFITSLLPLSPPLLQPTSRTKSCTISRLIDIHRTIDLYTAFLISGLMHAAGEYMMLSSSPSSHTSHFGGSMHFFMLQAVGIHLESLVLSFFTPFTAPIRTTPPPLLKTLLHICGYVCVWMWFAHTAPALFDPLVKAGFVDDLRALLDGWGVS
ncbi:hypothetical protein EYR36_003699 [Pleurotus pulmonarius]|nr:hypothetical protein EYR36_003699 [Pleurotus pulmonarius]